MLEETIPILDNKEHTNTNAMTQEQPNNFFHSINYYIKRPGIIDWIIVGIIISAVIAKECRFGFTHKVKIIASLKMLERICRKWLK